jgi:hypothetical protein
MGNEGSGEVRGSGSRAAPEGVLAMLRMPSVAAALGALFGLGLGIVLGRATVEGRSESALASAEAPLAVSSRAVSSRAEVPEQDEAEVSPADEYHVQLGRQLPEGKRGHGFERYRIEDRPVARLAGDESVVRFAVDANPGAYVLLAVVGLEGEKGALEAKLDGKPLAQWSLDSAWGAYSAQVPRDALSAREHVLSFQPKAAGGTVIGIDSIAVVPIGKHAAFGMGVEAIGRLVDGFSNREGKTVWSNGSQSSLGMALEPATGPYQLSVRAAALPAIAPLSVRCKVNGTDVGTADFTAKQAESHWSLPAGLLRAGVNRIDFLYPKTAKPADFDPKSGDKRQLALRFTRVELSPE